MPEQDVPIDLSGTGSRLVYDKERRTIKRAEIPYSTEPVIFTDFEKQQRDRDLDIVRSLAKQKPYCDQAWARMALAIAGSAIERGRLLTDAEKTENLAKAFDEDGDHETAAKIRRAK